MFKLLSCLRQCVLLLLLSAAGAWAGAETPSAWRVCVRNAPIPPYLYNDEQRLGIAERMLIDGGREVGFSVVVVRYPSQRCRMMLEAGQVDAILGAATAGNRAAYRFPMAGGKVDIGRRLARLHLVWVMRPESDYEWDGRAMVGQSHASLLVGTRTSMPVASEPVAALGFQVDSSAHSAQQTLMKLVARRVDLVVALQEEVEVAMRDPRLQSLAVLARPLSTDEFYAPVRHDLPAELQARAEAWWTAMARLRERPEYQVR